MATVFTDAGKAALTAILKNSSTVKYVAWGTGVGTALVGDTTLYTEASESRQIGTQTQQQTSVANDTYQVVGTMTCAGAGKTITNAGLFDASSGVTLWIKGDFTGIALNVNDQIQFTFTLQFT